MELEWIVYSHAPYPQTPVTGSNRQNRGHHIIRRPALVQLNRVVQNLVCQLLRILCARLQQLVDKTQLEFSAVVSPSMGYSVGKSDQHCAWKEGPMGYGRSVEAVHTDGIDFRIQTA
jgi:hypothetical protein